MATRPELHIAVAKAKSKASEYNDNFDMMMDYVDAVALEDKTYVDGFMPDVTGNAGKFLKTDGETTEWVNPFASNNTFSGTNTFSGATTLSGNVTISGSAFTFTRCTTRATSTSTASNSKVAVIVQNYRNGNYWYRVWSDGWIEQGYISSADETVPKTFTYLKSFTYSPTLIINVWNPTSSSSDTQVRNFGYERSTTGFKVSAGSNGYRFSWYACGY